MAGQVHRRKLVAVGQHHDGLNDSHHDGPSASTTLRDALKLTSMSSYVVSVALAAKNRSVSTENRSVVSVALAVALAAKNRSSPTWMRPPRSATS